MQEESLRETKLSCLSRTLHLIVQKIPSRGHSAWTPDGFGTKRYEVTPDPGWRVWRQLQKEPRGGSYRKKGFSRWAVFDFLVGFEILAIIYVEHAIMWQLLEGHIDKHC